MNPNCRPLQGVGHNYPSHEPISEDGIRKKTLHQKYHENLTHLEIGREELALDEPELAPWQGVEHDDPGHERDPEAGPEGHREGQEVQNACQGDTCRLGLVGDRQGGGEGSVGRLVGLLGSEGRVRVEAFEELLHAGQYELFSKTESESNNQARKIM